MNCFDCRRSFGGGKLLLFILFQIAATGFILLYHDFFCHFGADGNSGFFDFDDNVVVDFCDYGNGFADGKTEIV